ncbi:hypothetical protein [Rubrobacter indicoceani]|uniref:hypothetical protein n=1 Tax=Rubrobacter indicoceani TaxID=2051957 RepID=UPI0013C4EB4D|nr:hypothetical protein [Rubrobacter indicoceani]
MAKVSVVFADRISMGQNVYNIKKEKARQEKQRAAWGTEVSLGRIGSKFNKSNKQRAAEARLSRETHECYRLGDLLNFPRQAVQNSIEVRGTSKTKTLLKAEIRLKKKRKKSL